jgi:hypothetical protein
MLIRPNPAQAIIGDVGCNNIATSVEATDALMRGFTAIRDVGVHRIRLERRYRR